MAQRLLMRCRALGSALIAALGAGVRLEGKEVSTRQVILLLAVAGVTLLLASGTALAAFTLKGNQLKEVAVAQEDNDTYTYSGDWQDIPGASVTISPEKYDLVLARFNGQSLCHGGYAGGHCYVRIVAEYPKDEFPNAQLDPLGPGGSDGGSAFDSSANGDWEMHSMDRSKKFEGPVTLTVKAQWKHGGADTVCGGWICYDAPYFGLDDYSLTIERLT